MTPPKKRFVNYPAQPAEGRSTVGKCDLSNMFDSELKTSETVRTNEEKEFALVCLNSSDENLAESKRVADSYGECVKVSVLYI